MSSATRRRRRIMRTFKLTEISAVDRPAQQLARAVIMKQADVERQPAGEREQTLGQRLEELQSKEDSLQRQLDAIAAGDVDEREIEELEQVIEGLEAELRTELRQRGLLPGEPGRGSANDVTKCLDDTLHAMAGRHTMRGETMEQSFCRLMAEPSPGGEQFRALLDLRERVAG